MRENFIAIATPQRRTCGPPPSQFRNEPMRRLDAKLSTNEREFYSYSYSTKKNMWAAAVTV
jgi:hypothetical protein